MQAAPHHRIHDWLAGKFQSGAGKSLFNRTGLGGSQRHDTDGVSATRQPVAGFVRFRGAEAWVTTGCAAYAALTGLIGLWRWMDPLALQGSATVPMAPSTAALLVLLGTTVALQPQFSTRSVYRLVAYAIGAATALAALMVIARDTTGLGHQWSFGLPEVSGTVEGVPIGRMSPFTATGLLLLVAAQMLLVSTRRFHPGVLPVAIIGVVAVLLFALLSAVAYMVGAPLIAGTGIVPMAWSTSSALAALAFALLVRARTQTVPAEPLGTVQGKLVASFAAVVLLLALVATIAYVEFAGARASQRRLVDRDLAAVVDLVRLRANLSAERLDVALLLDLPPSQWGVPLRDHDRRLQEDEQILQRLKTLLADDRESLRALTTITTQRVAFLATRRDEVLPALQRGDVKTAKALFLSPQTERHQRLRELTRALDVRQSNEARAIIAQTDRRAGLALGILLGAGSISIGGAIAVGLVMYRSVGRYLEDRRRAEAAVTTERERFNSVLNELPVYAILLTPDYHVRFANEFFEKRFGRDQGRRCYEYLFNRSAPCEICETFKVLKTRAPLEWSWHGPDGRDYEIHDAPFLDADGSPLILEVGIDVTETRRAHRAIEQANAYNRSLIEASLDPMVTIGADGRIMDVNGATENATGRTRTELIGTDFSDYFTDRRMAQVGYQRVFRDGDVRDFPLELRHHDGSTRSVLYNASVYRDADGKPLGVFAAARDVTARLRAEQELRRTNRALRATTACNEVIVHARNEADLLRDICRVIVEEAGYSMAWVGEAERDAEKSVRPVATVGHDLCYLTKSRFTWADTEYGRGPTGTAIRTRQVTTCRNMREDPRFAPWREDACARGYASSIVLPLIIENDVYGAISIYAAEPDAFDTDEAKWLAELGDDIAYGMGALRLRQQREQAEKALQRASAYNRSLLEAALDPLVTIGADGRIQDVNAATEIATGCRRDELIGSDFSNYFTAPEKARAGYEQVFRDGTVRDFPLEIRNRSGATVSVLYNASVYRDERGLVAGVFAAARDITERKTAEEKIRNYAAELERSNQELERFAYVASHDLQEPLRTVSSFSQLLASRYQSRLDRDADEFIAFIVAGADRMQHLIEDLLAFSRVGTRGRPFTSVDLDGVLKAVTVSLATIIEETKARVTWDPLPRVTADEVQLTQVLQNLVGNAIKFHRDGVPPEVHVGATRLDDAWEFSVRDNGIGIDPQYFERIFVIFQRLHGRDEYPGTGIGLAICKKIVERHGGRMRVESEPGVGSTFHFTLPDTLSSP